MRNLEVLNIHKSFDSTHALNGVSFELKPQEIIVGNPDDLIDLHVAEWNEKKNL